MIQKIDLIASKNYRVKNEKKNVCLSTQYYVGIILRHRI